MYSKYVEICDIEAGMKMLLLPVFGLKRYSWCFILVALVWFGGWFIWKPGYEMHRHPHQHWHWHYH